MRIAVFTPEPARGAVDQVERSLQWTASSSTVSVMVLRGDRRPIEVAR